MSERKQEQEGRWALQVPHTAYAYARLLTHAGEHPQPRKLRPQEAQRALSLTCALYKIDVRLGRRLGYIPQRQGPTVHVDGVFGSESDDESVYMQESIVGGSVGSSMVAPASHLASNTSEPLSSSLPATLPLPVPRLQLPCHLWHRFRVVTSTI